MKATRCGTAVPQGKNTPDNLLGRMSKKAGLSTHFTLHCIRATSVTILKAAGLENSRVRSVTGHKRVISRKTDNSTTGGVLGNSQQFCGSSGSESSCCCPKHRSVTKSSCCAAAKPEPGRNSLLQSTV